MQSLCLSSIVAATAGRSISVAAAVCSCIARALKINIKKIQSFAIEQDRSSQKELNIMKNPESSKSKENDVKFIKKVSPNKAKLTVRKENGKIVEVEKTMAMGCVPSGHD
jgi:hypothetical protein